MRRITPVHYRTDANDRRLADEIMRRAGFDANDVLEIRVSEQGVEIDRLIRGPSGRPILNCGELVWTTWRLPT